MLIKWINRLAVMYRNRKVGVNSNQVDKAMRPPQNHDYECKKIVLETLKFNVSELIEFVKKDWTLGDLHGLNHWRRVHEHGCMLCVEGVNMNVVSAFAYLHDSARLSDCRDLQHGPRAMDNVMAIRHTILKNLSDDEIHSLCEACRLHTTTHRTGDITIDTCFDADRLDLDRCGIIPNPECMATPKGVEFAINFKEFKKRIRYKL